MTCFVLPGSSHRHGYSGRTSKPLFCLVFQYFVAAYLMYIVSNLAF